MKESLLGASIYGQHQLEKCVKVRLNRNDQGQRPTVQIHSPLKKHNAPTFANLYTVRKDSKENDKNVIMKVDRNVLQRLITAYEAGREVDLQSVLKHELMPVSISFAEMNGSMRIRNKSVLGDILVEGISCPEAIQLNERSAGLVIDGQALIVAIGKPQHAETFGDLSDTYVNSVLLQGFQFQRIDVVFDRYCDVFIK